MHSQLTPRLRDFVRDVAAFLEANLDPALRDKVKKISEKKGIDKILVPLAVYLAERHNLI